MEMQLAESAHNLGQPFVYWPTMRTEQVLGRSVSLQITDSKGTLQEFATPTDFLNYMAARGYLLQSEIKGKYSSTYRFKKS